MACGLPVVTSTKCGAAELVTEFNAGFVCASHDIDALTRHAHADGPRDARDAWSKSPRSRTASHARRHDAAIGAALSRSACCGVRGQRRASGQRPGALRYNRGHFVDAPTPHAPVPAAPPCHRACFSTGALLQYVRPYWWAFALAIVGMIIVAAGDVLMAYMVMPIVQKLQNPDPAMTELLPLAVVAVFLLRGIGSFTSEYGMAWTGHRVVFDLRREMIDHLLSLPTPYYDAQSSGRLISKFTFDAYQLAAATSSAITTTIRSALTIVGSIGLLFWLNWRLTLIAIVVLPLVVIVIRYFSRRLRRVARDVQHRTGSITHVLEEIVGGHRVVKIFGGEDYERGRAVAAANSCASR